MASTQDAFWAEIAEHHKSILNTWGVRPVKVQVAEVVGNKARLFRDNQPGTTRAYPVLGTRMPDELEWAWALRTQGGYLVVPIYDPDRQTRFLELEGGTMEGALDLGGFGSRSAHAASRAFVRNRADNLPTHAFVGTDPPSAYPPGTTAFVSAISRDWPHSNTVVTFNPSTPEHITQLSTGRTAASEIFFRSASDASTWNDWRKVLLTGDETDTGGLATEEYVDDGLAGKLDASGGVISGQLRVEDDTEVRGDFRVRGTANFDGIQMLDNARLRLSTIVSPFTLGNGQEGRIPHNLGAVPWYIKLQRAKGGGFWTDIADGVGGWSWAVTTERLDVFNNSGRNQSIRAQIGL